jgi:hypothetical protein
VQVEDFIVRYSHSAEVSMDFAAIPDVIQRNPPAPEEAVASVNRLLPAPLPEDYSALLAQADGVVADGFVLYSCAELPERNATFEVGTYAPGFVAVGDDNGGRALVMRGGSGRSPVFLVGHGTVLPACMIQIAGSLSEWLAAGCPLD